MTIHISLPQYDQFFLFLFFLAKHSRYCPLGIIVSIISKMISGFSLCPVLFISMIELTRFFSFGGETFPFVPTNNNSCWFLNQYPIPIIFLSQTAHVL